MRYNLLHKALLYFFSKAMIDEIEQEVLLVKKIDLIATKVKETKDNVRNCLIFLFKAQWIYGYFLSFFFFKDKFLNELDCVHTEWPKKKNKEDATASCRLPYNISYCTKEIDIKVTWF